MGEWGVKGGPSSNPAGRPKGSKTNIKYLSKAYKDRLNTPVSEDLRMAKGLPEGATYSDAIAENVVSRALGGVPDDKICFKAITELRETTEGKTPEKVIAAGSNEELTALAAIMQGEPAKPDGEEEETSEVESDED